MRLRITFSKTGALRYTGHLDLHKIWERTARRAGLPLAYSHGFHPLPKIQLAAALPLGFIGRAEVVDMWLESADFSPQILELLQSTAPHGLNILNIEIVGDRAPALQTQVTAAEYEVTLLDSVDEAALTRSLPAIMEAKSLPRERRGKPLRQAQGKLYDLRPLIESLELRPGDGSGPPRLFMRLAAREGATGRPEEVLAAMDIPFENTRIERKCLILKNAVE